MQLVAATGKQEEGPGTSSHGSDRAGASNMDTVVRTCICSSDSLA
jgi:hypothetical protein